MMDLAITGAGLVTPLGLDLTATVTAWHAGAPLPTALVTEWAGTDLAGTRIALPPAHDPAQGLKNRRLLKFMSPQGLLMARAAREALEQARLIERGLAPERIGLFAAIGLAAAELEESLTLLKYSLDERGDFSALRFGREALAAVNPLLSFRILPNMPACLVSILENIKGPNGIFTPWADQAGVALLEAAEALERGEIEAALVVAADQPNHLATLAYLRRVGLLAPGEVASAAAGALVLEPAAQTRRPLARLKALSLAPTAGAPRPDPLVPRLGRTLAAAPLIAAVLASQGCLSPRFSLDGEGGQTLEFEVEPWPVG